MKAAQGALQQGRVTAGRLYDLQVTRDGRIYRPRSGGGASSSDAWLAATVSGASVRIAAGAILIPGRGFIWTDGGGCDISGGSASTPMWVCIVIAKSTLVPTLVASVTDPNPQRGDAWEIPLARAYRNGATATIVDSGIPLMVPA